MNARLILLAALLSALAACGEAPSNATAANPAPMPPGAPVAPAAVPAPFDIEELARFNEPWAMRFLPDGRLLITEKPGSLALYTLGGARITVSGVPEVDYGGQGGLGDVILHPAYAENGWIYLSYAEAGAGDTRGAAVARATLRIEGDQASLSEVQVIWRQVPKVDGRGHYGHRLAFGPDSKLYISSGERQHFDPAQDMQSNLGKVVRLNDDGTLPPDNPFADQGGVAAQIWSLGHRNPLGLAFAPDGRLWELEHGPLGGDEFNLIKRGANYGYPIVSNGSHYDGRDIPDHDTRPEFHAPAISWTPVIAPGDFIFYTGDRYPGWQGHALATGLASAALVQIEITGTAAREVERYAMGTRIRAIAQGPDGLVYLLQDGRDGALMRLKPRA